MEDKQLVIKKSIPLGAKVWAAIIIFGFMGQLTWAVENSYFSTYIQQRITAESWATSATVIFSAVFATIASIFGGAISDRIGKRRPFICWGYFVWGLLTMAFALFGDQAYVGDAQFITSVVIIFVAMDALMSFIGSMANDAAYSAWLTDVTDVTNRSFVDIIVGWFPLLAMVVILVGFSMGGIACREYLTSPMYADDVHQLITISSPHLGSEFAVLYDGEECLGGGVIGKVYQGKGER